MPEQSVDELKQLSLPALRHAELVNLARTESPNKAYELASLRWPRRQAKATRSLAILRRDYGQPALEAIILEHARPTGTEHAQGDTQMTIDQLYPDGVRDVVFFHDCTSPRDTDTLHIRRFTGTNYTDLKFSEEITRLELDEPQTRTLVSRVVKAMLEQWANPKAQQFFYGTMWSSALL